MNQLIIGKQDQFPDKSSGFQKRSSGFYFCVRYVVINHDIFCEAEI